MIPTPEILLCELRFFSIDYEINPWMDVNVPAISEPTWEQWNACATSC
jgi:hypothetical protein